MLKQMILGDKNYFDRISPLAVFCVSQCQFINQFMPYRPSSVRSKYRPNMILVILFEQVSII